MRNTIAIVLGLLLGGFANGAILKLNGTLITLPPGTDMSTPEGIAAAMPLLEFKHFLIVFLAHGLGTFLGTVVATLIARTKAIYIPIIIGSLFFIGGAMMVYALPSAPLIFDITDLALAYFPMAFLGYIIIKSTNKKAIH